MPQTNDPHVHYAKHNVLAAAVAWFRAGQHDSAEAGVLAHAVAALLDAEASAPDHTNHPLYRQVLDMLGIMEAADAIEGSDQPHVVVTYDTDPVTWTAQAPSGVCLPVPTITGPFPNVTTAWTAAQDDDHRLNADNDPFPFLSIAVRLHAAEVPAP